MSFVHDDHKLEYNDELQMGVDSILKSESNCELDLEIESNEVKENCEIEIDEEEHLIESSIDALEESEVFIENIFEDQVESLMDEPVAKKIKLETSTPANILNVAPQESPQKYLKTPQSNALDEYDHFGKKVALQLRELAKKDKKASRAAEIHVLQILMQYEESAEKT
jgi:hypothetical protein